MEITRTVIEENLNDPMVLENMYHSDKKAFTEMIKAMYEPGSNTIIKYWYTRLFYESLNEPIEIKSNKKKYIYTAILVVITWLPIRLGAFFTTSAIWDDYFLKAIPAIFTITLSLFFMFDTKKNIKNIALCVLPSVIVYVYFILLPDRGNYSLRYEKYDSQSLDNAFIFSFLLLWFFVLLAYSKFNIKKLSYSTFLEIFGETVVWSTMFLLGGIVITALTSSLFNAINEDVSDFFLMYVITPGAVACPFVALLVIEKMNKVKLSVTIANIFLPLVLLPLLVFGIVSMFSEAKPYDDRDIFIIYNMEMVVVVAILVFTGINEIKNKFLNICSYILPAVTILLDLITISAVIYRLSKYGISANKITLLGTNIFMLGHLGYIVYLKIKQKMAQNVLYLPLYFLWALVVVFVFPFLFKAA